MKYDQRMFVAQEVIRKLITMAIENQLLFIGNRTFDLFDGTVHFINS